MQHKILIIFVAKIRKSQKSLINVIFQFTCLKKLETVSVTGGNESNILLGLPPVNE